MERLRERLSGLWVWLAALHSCNAVKMGPLVGVYRPLGPTSAKFRNSYGLAVLHGAFANRSGRVTPCNAARSVSVYTMTDEGGKRRRGPGRPVLENLRNAGPLLREGELTRVHRVRASTAVHEWFGAMSAQQRGAALAHLMWEDRRVPAVLATYTGAAPYQPAEAPTRAEVGQSAIPAFAARPHASEEPLPEPTASLKGLSILRVVSSTLPSALRNDLRWPPQSYQKLEATLSRAPVLKLETIRGKAAWRVPTGESIRKDTVIRLLQAGLLASDL